MQLLEIDFSGVINVGSSTPCSKYEFGLQLAEEFCLDSSCIQKGLMSDHSFSALRSNKLDIDVMKPRPTYNVLSVTKINNLQYHSIKDFVLVH